MSQQSTGSNDLLFEVRDGIGRATFNRPHARNAFTFEMYERLAQICEQANRDRSIKVLVFQGAGDKAFASGTDINQPTVRADFYDPLIRNLGSILPAQQVTPKGMSRDERSDAGRGRV